MIGKGQRFIPVRMDRTVLVTGGAGYIGSHVCKMLAGQGYVPIVYDNFSTGRREAAVFGPVVEGDILDPKALDAAFEAHEPVAVIHLAAKIAVAESVEDPAPYYETNVQGTWCLLEAMRRHGVMQIIFSSSAAVYGTPPVTVVSEEVPANPISPYGRTKLMMEQMLGDYEKAYGMSSVAFRYFNAVGADPEGQIGPMSEAPSNLIPLALQVLAGELSKLTIFGIDYPTRDGTGVRDYVHVSDLADAHVKALNYLREGGKSEVMNLGTNEGHSVKDIVQMLKNLSNRPLPVVYNERRAGDSAEVIADARKARDVLGWVPQYSDLKTICLTAWKFKEKQLAAKE